MSNVINDQYPLGPGGAYGVATCIVAENLAFEDTKGVGKDPLAFPEPFCPFLRMTKVENTQAQRLHVVIFAPQGFVLDPKSPLVCDYMGTELFFYVNFKQNEVDPTKKQCFVIHADFTVEFSAKLKRKKIFVIPVHGDPEEGEATKVTVEDEGEV